MIISHTFVYCLKRYFKPIQYPSLEIGLSTNSTCLSFIYTIFGWSLSVHKALVVRYCSTWEFTTYMDIEVNRQIVCEDGQQKEKKKDAQCPNTTGPLFFGSKNVHVPWSFLFLMIRSIIYVEYIDGYFVFLDHVLNGTRPTGTCCFGWWTN